MLTERAPYRVLKSKMSHTTSNKQVRGTEWFGFGFEPESVTNDERDCYELRRSYEIPRNLPN